MILIFCDVISSIKRRDMTKTNIVGLIFLAIGVTGYLITDLILPFAMPGNEWPPLASLVWILLFWIYVIMDACVTMKDIGKARRKKKGLPPKLTRKQRKQARAAAATTDVESYSGVDEAERAEQVWEENLAQQKVEEEELRETDDK